jgi:hypothetical protein
MVKTDKCIVITSINSPNSALRAFAEGSREHGYRFIVIGDTKSPADFELTDCEYYSVPRQLETGLSYAQVCPTRHYARKNIGYLIAARSGVQIIRDTDDDNLPRDGFWDVLPRETNTPTAENSGWLNVYRYFSDSLIWPRGLPLNHIQDKVTEFSALPTKKTDCPIQQGLADVNPDVDAIYRLILPLPQDFRKDRRVTLSKGAWCPFNSQNTTWFVEAFPLLYLPAYCSFRMTDIWRSFVAQRIGWENGWSILFHEPTVWQERNEHDLMKDFIDEIPGYTNNNLIKKELESLSLRGGVANLGEDMRSCYRRLCELKIIGEQELPLLDAWLADLGK